MNWWWFLRQDGWPELDQGSVAEPRDPLSRSWLLPGGRGCSGVRQEVGVGEGTGPWLLGGKLRGSRCLPIELLCEIPEQLFPPQTLQLSGTSPGKWGRVIFTPSPTQMWQKQEGLSQMLGVLRPRRWPVGGSVGLFGALLGKTSPGRVTALAFPPLALAAPQTRGTCSRTPVRLKGEAEARASVPRAPGLCFHGNLDRLLSACSPSPLPGPGRSTWHRGPLAFRAESHGG